MIWSTFWKVIFRFYTRKYLVIIRWGIFVFWSIIKHPPTQKNNKKQQKKQGTFCESAMNMITRYNRVIYKKYVQYVKLWNSWEKGATTEHFTLHSFDEISVRNNNWRRGWRLGQQMITSKWSWEVYSKIYYAGHFKTSNYKYFETLQNNVQVYEWM